MSKSSFYGVLQYNVRNEFSNVEIYSFDFEVSLLRVKQNVSGISRQSIQIELVSCRETLPSNLTKYNPHMLTLELCQQNLAESTQTKIHSTVFHFIARLKVL
jgi:hypothetical protein